MCNTFVFTVREDFENERIDKVIAAEMDSLSRSALQNIIAQGGVRSNGKTVHKNDRVKTGDEIEITVPEPQELCTAAQEMPLDIRYEDDDLLVVNKQKGMVVHPAAGNYENTLVNALLYHCKGSLSGINGVIRPGIVHRIDKDTSGLLVVAKNDFAHISLAKQIKEHSFTREYQAVVHGSLKQDNGTVDAPIGRSQNDRKKMAVTVRNSRNAITHFQVIARYKGFTHIKINLETGRTHQIRVHMANIGHPVAGDLVYGPKNTLKELNGQCLHAGLIGFHHPRDGRYLEVRSELPDYFENFLRKIDG